MKKFFNGLLVLVLLVIIFGGLGYIGYNYFYMNHSGLAGIPGQTGQTAQPADANANAAQNQQGMQGMTGMQNGAANSGQQDSNAQSNVSAATEIAAKAIKNKDSLDGAIATLNEAVELMTLDPYAAGGAAATGSDSSMSVQGNTTINIFPQSSNATGAQPDSNTMSSAMSNMGTKYDPAKMEQLHSGLYKLALGMQLLDQLKNEFVVQAENASANVVNPAQYYANQYTLTLQSKNKLNQALNYINESANLVNLNPYISQNGLVYDKERMGKIHQSIYKLANGVAALNLLGDDLTKQAILTANTAQTYINAANTAAVDNTAMNHAATPSTGLFDSLFNNLNLQSVISIILVIFVSIFILGILGFIFSLLKTAPSQKA